MEYAILAVIIVVLVAAGYRYIKGSYYQVTKNTPLHLFFDKGKYGEYLTYQKLRYAEKSGTKFLFNIYIPKGENETTEIDVLMIHPNGLFVFESKNYSGWIFGNEFQKTWYQTLPKGKGRSQKEAFYNPVMQNRTHIKHLKALLGEEVPMHSIITFSERCTLKKVEIKSSDIYVINRYDVSATVRSICGKAGEPVLNQKQIDGIYNKLYPYTQVDAAVKARHIQNIEKKLETEKEEKVEAPLVVEAEQEQKKCPRCGGILLLRTASKGANAGNQFYGCSNYPKCRYVQNVDIEDEQK